MEFEKLSLQSIRQDLLDNHLQIKTIVQDITTFRGSLNELVTLNEAGRSKLAILRKNIDRLNDWARDTGDADLSKEVDTQRDQFSKVLQSFRKANVTTLLEIQKENREELMALKGEGNGDSNCDGDGGCHVDGDGDGGGHGNDGGDGDNLQQNLPKTSKNIRHRGSLVSQENNVTEKMLAISRHLSETTQKSAMTLETLVSSSQNVQVTRDELQNTVGTISQSGKLLKKYGRRECTDKMLLFFAFTFFMACVFYIIQKRLF